MRNVILVLHVATCTQGWQKLVDQGDDLKTVDRIVSQFSIPLQAAATQTEEVHSEFQNVLEYSTQHILLSTYNIMQFGGESSMLHVLQIELIF